MRHGSVFDSRVNALNAGESQSFPLYNTEEKDDTIASVLAGFRQERFRRFNWKAASGEGAEQPKEAEKWLHQGVYE